MPVSKAGAKIALHMSVSAELFELATEAIRVHSNARGRIVTFDQLVAAMLDSDRAFAAVDVASLRDHLIAQPAGGTHSLMIRLGATGQTRFNTFRENAASRLARTLEPAEALSLLLFAHVVEARTAAVLAALALGAQAPDHAVGGGGNILDFKR